MKGFDPDTENQVQRKFLQQYNVSLEQFQRSIE